MDDRIRPDLSQGEAERLLSFHFCHSFIGNSFFLFFFLHSPFSSSSSSSSFSTFFFIFFFILLAFPRNSTSTRQSLSFFFCFFLRFLTFFLFFLFISASFCLSFCLSFSFLSAHHRRSISKSISSHKKINK